MSARLRVEAERACADGGLRLRRLARSDFDAIVALQLLCFPKMDPWTAHEFERQLASWPFAQVGLFVQGGLVASACQLITDSAVMPDEADWDTVSDCGLLGTHDPHGDTLYGVEMQVHPRLRGLGFSRRLYDWRKQLCRQRGLARMLVGGRIPGYGAHQHRMSPEAYVAAVCAGQLDDPVLPRQLACGFVLRGVLRNYLPLDTDSAGHATCLEWRRG